MAVRDSTVNELTALCGERKKTSPDKSWSQIVSDAIRGRGITFGPDVAELKRRIIQTGAEHSATKRRAEAAARKRVGAEKQKIAS